MRQSLAQLFASDMEGGGSSDYDTLNQRVSELSARCVCAPGLSCADVVGVLRTISNAVGDANDQ
jgi:hypothetical protein